MDHVCYDVEISHTVEEVGGWDFTDKMGVGAAAVWEFATERMRIYGPQDVPALQDRLLKADRISGFNISTFDHYVTFGVRRGDSHEALTRLAPKTDDLLDRIWKALGNREKGWKLNDVAQRTLGVCKVEDGANAPLLFQSGDWGKLCNYVADDVAIERDLTAFVDKYGFLIAGSGRLLRLPPWKPVGAV